ncbi:hypothetical protein C8Q73DRAFT_676051 [Cubamyces lactineus]|nr:hypothetical protein C8Q73DRAFT_676051 [Cubamyces lactineus]
MAEAPLSSFEARMHTLQGPDIRPISSVPDTSRDNVSQPEAPTGQPSPNDPPAVSSAASQPRKIVPAPWFFARVRAVYIGRAEFIPGKISHRWLIVCEVGFLITALGQIALTAVLMYLGATNRDRETGVKSELEACPELAVVDILWLSHPVYIGYFLLWAHWLKRKVLRLNIVRLVTAASQSSDVDGDPPDGAQNERTEATVPGQRLSDEDMKKLLPTPLNILIHMRLVALAPLLTWILYFITLPTWLARRHHCLSTSPHIYLLTAVIVSVVNLRIMVYSWGTLLYRGVDYLMRTLRSRLPSVVPLSQAALDRIPLVIYRAADCDVPLIEASISHRDSATTTSPGQTHPKNRLQPSGLFRVFPKPMAPPLRLPDVEDGTEETPLLNLEGPSDVEENPEGMPLIDLAEGSSAAVAPVQDSPYPYITVPDDEAKCTICLCDFTDSSGLAVTTELDVQLIRLNDSDPTRSDEPGHGALLRRLSCGHIYHKECIDPWLIEKSGRCPYCQKAVEIPGTVVKWSFWRILKYGYRRLS